MSNNEYFIWISTIFFAAGNGIMWPSFLSILSRAAGRKYQGAVQGYASSTGSLASIIGLIIGGFVYASLGAVTFLFPAIMMLLIFMLSFRLLSMEKSL